MSYATKQELAEALYMVVETIESHSPETLRNFAHSIEKAKQSIPHLGKPFEHESVIPKLGTKWSNNKSGDVYEIVGLSNLKSTREDFPATVIYNCTSGNTWSRTLTSFLLKFKPV